MSPLYFLYRHCFAISSHIYIYICNNNLNLEEGPPFGGEDCAHIPVRLAAILIVLHVVDTLINVSTEVVLFFAHLERTRLGKITPGTSASLAVSSHAFILHIFMFSGIAPLGYDALLCFDALRVFSRQC